jgi:hypothetical protein
MKGITLMNARFNPQAEDSQRLRVGSIGPHLQTFATLVSASSLTTPVK